MRLNFDVARASAQPGNAGHFPGKRLKQQWISAPLVTVLRADLKQIRQLAGILSLDSRSLARGDVQRNLGRFAPGGTFVLQARVLKRTQQQPKGFSYSQRDVARTVAFVGRVLGPGGFCVLPVPLV